MQIRFNINSVLDCRNLISKMHIFWLSKRRTLFRKQMNAKNFLMAVAVEIKITLTQKMRVKQNAQI